MSDDVKTSEDSQAVAGGCSQLRRDYFRYPNDVVGFRLLLVVADKSPTIKFPVRWLLDLIEEIEQLRIVKKAIDDVGLDISPCGNCGTPIACVPDGLPMCRKCGIKSCERSHTFAGQ